MGTLPFFVSLTIDTILLNAHIADFFLELSCSYVANLVGIHDIPTTICAVPIMRMRAAKRLWYPDYNLSLAVALTSLLCSLIFKLSTFYIVNFSDIPGTSKAILPGGNDDRSLR